MTKEQLLAVVQAKPGFVRVVSDNLAPDSVPGDVKEKRYSVIETLNGDGTKGVTNVFYIVDTSTNEAWFYNVEPVTFDNKYKDVPTKTLEALHAYCKATFQAYFLIPDRIDANNQWAVVEAYVAGGTPVKLTKSLKMVYKQGTNPITHVDIV